MEMIDKIANMLEAIQMEQKLQKEEMKEMQKSITNDINTNINEKFNEIDIKYKKLEEKLGYQEKQLDFLEKENRKRNLVFFGLPDDEKSYFQLQKKVTDVITTNMKLVCEKYDIVNVRRIGKKGNNPRPVTVTFSTMWKKIEILKNKKALEESTYYIKEDFPHKVLELRKTLQSQVLELRREGKEAIIKYDKIVILEDTYSRNRQPKKRFFSTSPENDNKNTKFKNKDQQSKKSKQDITSFFSPHNTPQTSTQEKVAFKSQP